MRSSIHISLFLLIEPSFPFRPSTRPFSSFSSFFLLLRIIFRVKMSILSMYYVVIDFVSIHIYISIYLWITIRSLLHAYKKKNYIYHTYILKIIYQFISIYINLSKNIYWSVHKNVSKKLQLYIKNIYINLYYIEYDIL